MRSLCDPDYYRVFDSKNYLILPKALSVKGFDNAGFLQIFLIYRMLSLSGGFNQANTFKSISRQQVVEMHQRRSYEVLEQKIRDLQEPMERNKRFLNDINDINESEAVCRESAPGMKNEANKHFPG